jgi:peptide/nickel transport system permease protein
VARILVQRLGSGLVTILAVTAVAFVLVPLAQASDPATANSGEVVLSPQRLAALHHQLGLDLPLPVRYAKWFTGALHGDLGVSFLKNESVTAALGQAIPVTASIALVSAILILVIALPFGVLAAMHRDSWLDRLVVFLGSLGISTPNFVVGLVLVAWLGVNLHVLPSIGYADLSQGPWDWFSHVILPSAALAVPASAVLTRYVRGSFVEVLNREFVQAAIGKGLPQRAVIGKHVLKNAMAPVVTVFGLELRTLLGGAVAVEAVFNMPGLGRLTIDSVYAGDYPVIEGVVLLAAVVVLAINLLVDLSYTYLNPKVRVT